MATVPLSSSEATTSDMANELLDEEDDAVDIELRGVDPDGVICGLHAHGIALVAQPEIGGQSVGADVGTLGQAALRPHAPVSREVDLHVRARRNDRADVAALHDCVGLGGELPLPLAHHLADLRMARHNGHRAVGARMADRRRDVLPRDPYVPRFVELHRVGGGKLAEAFAVLELDLLAQRQPGHGAVHGAGVEVAHAESLGEPPSHGALAGPGRPVDGDDHRCERESSSSKKPGNDIAAASAPSMRTPSWDTRPATAASIASRWSPKLLSDPPLGRAGTPRTVKPPAVAWTRAPRERRAVATVSMRSDSFARSSPAPRTRLVPRAIDAASTNSGSSSIMRGTSAGTTSVATSSAWVTPRSATGSPDCSRRLNIEMRAPMRSRASSRPVRVGFTPMPWTMSSEPARSVAATMNGAAAEKSPGTSTSPSEIRSACSTEMRLPFTVSPAPAARSMRSV